MQMRLKQGRYKKVYDQLLTGGCNVKSLLNDRERAEAPGDQEQGSNIPSTGQRLSLQPN